MDILYRLFYTSFSMSLMLLAILPVVLILRLIFKKLPRKFTCALWGLFYLRGICPIGLTSPVCLWEDLNRRFHLLVRSIGLTTQEDTGLMSGWRRVYESDISVTVPYMVCTIFWIVGFVAIVSFVFWKQRNIVRKLKDAAPLFDRVYQSEKIQTPMRTWIFWRKIYLPDHLSARETKNILVHEQMHGKRKDDLFRMVELLISCVHWWNPFIWLAWYLSGVDMEIACDEAVVNEIGWEQKEYYAQDIMNMKKEESGASVPFALFIENRLERRAEHIIYLEKTTIPKKGLAVFVLTVCFFGWFGLSAFYNKWNGGTWSDAEISEEEPLFEVSEKRTITNEIIGKCETTNPKDEIVDLELVMTQGSFQEGEGYTGQCMLRMKDVKGETIDTLLLSEIFEGQKQQYFEENLTLTLEDYNEDGVMELSLGQKPELSEEELIEVASGSAVKADALQMYYLINIEEEALNIISEPIYISGVTRLQTGSMAFSYVQQAKGVITTMIGDGIASYVWDESQKKYCRQNITQEEIDARKVAEEDKPQIGKKNQHTLLNGNQSVAAEVVTKIDKTGKEKIMQLRIYGSVEGEEIQRFKDIEGYYRSFDWVTVTDEETNGFRYGVLGYGDDTGQGFILYDVKEQKEIYRQDKDYQILEKILKGYDDSEISFAEGSAAIYSIMELQDGDNITIGFAADAGDGILLSGRYQYVISTGQTSNLTYTRKLEE